jgi:hypothetical protein
MFFDEVSERVALLTIQPADQEGEPHLESRYVDQRARNGITGRDLAGGAQSIVLCEKFEFVSIIRFHSRHRRLSLPVR